MGTSLRAVVWIALLALALGTQDAAAQMADIGELDLHSVGWSGFLDQRFFLESFGELALAIVLGALIAFHPMTPRTVDTLHEAELPKVYILYALIGAMVGVTVLEYGMVVGFVVFGLGGLMRFRTDMESTRDTGRLIAVTLLGLISGLNLPHFAILSAAFVYALIFWFDSQPACRIVVKRLPKDNVGGAAEAYRKALLASGAKILGEKKSFSKERVEFVFRLPRGTTREKLHTALCDGPPANLRGEIDWEIE